MLLKPRHDSAERDSVNASPALVEKRHVDGRTPYNGCTRYKRRVVLRNRGYTSPQKGPLVPPQNCLVPIASISMWQVEDKNSKVTTAERSASTFGPQPRIQAMNDRICSNKWTVSRFSRQGLLQSNQVHDVKADHPHQSRQSL